MDEVNEKWMFDATAALLIKSLMPTVFVAKGAVVFAATYRPCFERCDVENIKSKHYHTHSDNIRSHCRQR